jgi:hypothetical protein
MGRVVAAIALVLLTLGSALAQENAHPEVDQSGKGAVLCMWSIYVAVEQGVERCDLPPMAGDADVAPAIRRIEDFILENTTQGISQAVLDGYKARGSEQPDARQCADIGIFRKHLLENIAAITDDLLSVPREPLWNPCL